MEGELFFEIPDDQEVMVSLVEVVPSEWSWVDGDLCAPKHLIDSGSALANTIFMVQRFHDINPTFSGISSKDKVSGPDLFAIMVEQKLPGLIRFDEAGYDSGVITFKLAKRIAVGFLRKGYRGNLTFFKDCHDNNKYDNPARCSMIFQHWKGDLMGEAGVQPARVRLEWKERYGGDEKDVTPIVDVCRSLSLRQYVPVTTTKVSV